MTKNTTISPALLRPEEAAQYLGVAVQTLANRRSAGVGPIFVKVGRSVRYRLADLEAYVAQLPEGEVAA